MLEATPVKPELWLRYMWTTLSSYGVTTIQSLIPFLITSIVNDPLSMQFMKEIEENRTLPSWMCWLQQTSEHICSRPKYTTTPCVHTGSYLHFEPYHPPHVKTGVIQTFIKRAQHICNSKDCMKSLLERLFISAMFF